MGYSINCQDVICICNDLYAPTLRPIRQIASILVICICNDLYAPALRPIHQIAKLKHICKKEGYKTNSIDWQPLLNIL
ncbi:hypothetical protein HPP92_027764, partial [Vanilla planifolia]